MKKWFSKSKEREEKPHATDKKANAVEDKAPVPAAGNEKVQAPSQELYWDGYSDIGYC